MTNPAPPQAVLLDIEGTTTPISFVHEVLFPYARARLPELVRQADAPGADPAVAACLDAVRAGAPGQDPLAVLLGWMDADTKATPLKTLQGLVWREGYAAGALHGATYPDVAPALRRWHAAGLGLYIYSSGSVEAQRLIFRHADAGDLSPLLSGYFDTATGPKRAAGSYRAIAASIGLPPGSMLFLSDVAAELDAAAEAGLAVCQLVRPDDGTQAGPRHPVAHDFTAVDARFGLPGSTKGDPR